MEDMNPDTLKRFDRARHRAGVPFVVNSAFRTVEHEISRGRDGTSSHTKGQAMDIRAVGGRQRYLILEAMMDEGFNRIGVYPGYFHFDDDPTKHPNVLWP